MSLSHAPKLCSPWLFGHSNMGFRHGMHVIPFLGFPALLQSVGQERCLVVAWPMSATIDAGAAVTDISQQLESLAPSDACKHMSAVSHSVVLGDGDACYIPAGHHLFTLGCGGPSFLLYQPLFFLRGDLSSNDGIRRSQTGLEDECGFCSGVHLTPSVEDHRPCFLGVARRPPELAHRGRRSAAFQRLKGRLNDGGHFHGDWQYGCDNLALPPLGVGARVQTGSATYDSILDNPIGSAWGKSLKHCP